MNKKTMWRIIKSWPIRYLILLVIIPLMIVAYLIVCTGTLIRIFGWLLVINVDKVREELQDLGFGNLKN